MRKAISLKRYMIRLLESNGFVGDMDYDCTGNNIIEYHSKGGFVFHSATITITEATAHSVKLFVTEQIGRRNRPVQVHYHFIKVKGEPGAYFLENCVVQKIIKDKDSPELLTEPDEATGFAVFDQELLLDQAEHMPDHAVPFAKMKKQDHVRPIGHIGHIKTSQDHVNPIKSVKITNSEYPGGIKTK